jgi:hypothetical protein
MANTTNYNWETPDDTDLVKDGAAAIRTLGSSVDTTTKALNPSTTLGDIEYRSATANTNTRLPIGTTGQVLSVVGGVPAWATSDDANAIQNALLTTTGDTIYASGASTPARLGIGTTGQILTVAGGVPSWATPAAGGLTFVGCYLTNATAPTISNDTDTIITFGAENYDTDGFHSTSTNTGRITIPSGKAGKYLFTAAFRWTANATGRRIVYLRKNGSTIGAFETSVNSTTYPSLQVNQVSAASVSDYFELVVYQTSGGNLAFLDSDFFFQASYLGA